MWKHEYLLEIVGVVGARYHVVVVVYLRLNEGQAISIMATPSVEYTTGKRGKDNAQLSLLSACHYIVLSLYSAITIMI